MTGKYRNIRGAILKNISHPMQAVGKYERLIQRDALMNETFFEQAYHWLVEQLRPGTTVIDIGANIGDTAIYFAQFSEVRRVIAYEPFPYTYRLMLDHLQRCPLSYKITAKNEAVGERVATIIMPESEEDSAGLDVLSLKRKSGVAVKVTSLSAVLKELKDVAIKCDAEGAEENLFRTDLSNVYAVILEWHGRKALAGAAKSLRERGFAVRVKIGPSGAIGYIYAVKSLRKGGRANNP